MKNKNEDRNIELIKRFHLTANVGDRTFHNGVEYIDLGLPSGTKWATMNIGAESIEDFGLYFQWGDTQGYTKLDVGNVKCFDWETYKLSIDNGLSCTKYNSEDGKTILDLEDDTAHVNLGGSWRMPTEYEFIELIHNTNNRKTSVNGIKGRKFINKEDNTKWIFIPFGGFAYEDCVESDANRSFLWSSSRYLDIQGGISLQNLYDSVFCRENIRPLGFQIRGVFKE